MRFRPKKEDTAQVPVGHIAEGDRFTFEGTSYRVIAQRKSTVCVENLATNDLRIFSPSAPVFGSRVVAKYAIDLSIGDIVKINDKLSIVVGTARGVYMCTLTHVPLEPAPAIIEDESCGLHKPFQVFEVVRNE